MLVNGTLPIPDAKCKPNDYRAISAEQADELHEAMSGLRPTDREALRLYYFHGLSYREAATKMGIPLGSLKTCIDRAKWMLRNRLAA